MNFSTLLIGQIYPSSRINVFSCPVPSLPLKIGICRKLKLCLLTLNAVAAFFNQMKTQSHFGRCGIHIHVINCRMNGQKVSLLHAYKSNKNINQENIFVVVVLSVVLLSVGC